MSVSVVIAAYNAAEHIGRALRSLRRQSRVPDEIIVVDDGSEDNTAAAARFHGARVLTQSNAGPAAARNVGIRAASGEWIAFLDADDLWLEQSLERRLAAAQGRPEIGLVFSDFLFLDERGTRHRTGFDDLDAVRRFAGSRKGQTIYPSRDALGTAFPRAMFILTSTVLVRRSLLLGDELFDTAMRCAEDYELFLRLLKRTDAAVLDEPLTAYRRHAMNVTADLDLDLLSREQLLRHVTEAPERYPAGAAAYFAEERPQRIRRAASYALRGGRFDTARERAMQSLRAQPSLSALTILALCGVCDNHLGRTLHATLRRMWLQRPGKYRAS